MKIKLLVTTLIAMLMVSSMSIMAAESPTASKYYTVTVGGQSVSESSSTDINLAGGKVTVSSGSVQSGSEVTLSVSAEDGNTFQKWILTGNYEIVSGSLDGDNITIIPEGNIDINASFLSSDGEEVTTVANDSNDTVNTDSSSTDTVEENQSSDTASSADSTESNDSSTSPQTGVPVLPAMFGLLVATGLGLLSLKKINA